MRIINQRVKEDIERDIPLKIELGSLGPSAHPGYYGLDILERPGVDIVANLEEPLSGLPDHSVGEIVAYHLFEHITDVSVLMRELNRVMRPGGRLKVVVPHFTNPRYYSDPTHRTPFGLYSMYYFCPRRLRPDLVQWLPEYDPSLRFEIDHIGIYFYRMGLIDKVVAPVLERLINRGGLRVQDWFERRISPFFHASEIHYRVRVVG